jgi:hypothetical protein
MPEKNYLPDSGRIDLNAQNDTADVSPNSEIPIEETKVETAGVDVVEKEVTEPIPVSEIDNNNNNIPPSNTEPHEETGRFSPNVIAVAAIVSGILIMSAGYVAYRYFSRDDFSQQREVPRAEVQIANDEIDYKGIIEDLDGRITSGVSTSRAEEWEEPGDSSGIVAVNSESSEGESGVIAQQPNAAAQQTQVLSQQSERSIWTANNYEQGDISSGSYTVISGDTLWEIAEGVYGNGSDWHKIADANGVSYLSNGNPLIIPGQILNIPI